MNVCTQYGDGHLCQSDWYGSKEARRNSPPPSWRIRRAENIAKIVLPSMHIKAAIIGPSAKRHSMAFR